MSCFPHFTICLCEFYQTYSVLADSDACSRSRPLLTGGGAREHVLLGLSSRVVNLTVFITEILGEYLTPFPNQTEWYMKCDM